MPSVEHGVLAGSRRQCYDEQIHYKETHYPHYVVGRIRELVIVAMLHYVKNDVILFKTHITEGRCKEKFKNGDFVGYKVLLIDPRSDRGGILVFSDVDDARESTGLLVYYRQMFSNKA